VGLGNAADALDRGLGMMVVAVDDDQGWWRGSGFQTRGHGTGYIT
jgi:hypothetical protein